MALINCPECHKEISDKVKVCPHCGYPLVSESNNANTQRVEVIGIKINSQKIKPIIISIIVVAIVILVGFLIYKNISKNNYITNLGTITQKMLEGGVIAEELTDLARDVWRNTIYKEYSARTEKYTFSSSGNYNSDFNASLRSLAHDPDVILKKTDLKNIREEVDELMKLLQNPPKELQNSYNDLDRLYRVFTSYAELAMNPSGSLTSFSSKINDYNSEFLENYNKLKIYIK